MSRPAMSSMERTLTALGHREPDRVPFFLLTSLQGARELDLSIRDYYARAEHVVAGQLRLLEKYRADCVYAFFHAALEVEAWGGEVLFRTDGPPNAGAPVFGAEGIDRLQTPRIGGAPGLQRVLATIRALKARLGDTVPIIGVVISPFSLPVMQMGFEPYLDLLQNQPERLARLMAINEDFTAAWANAQLEAGATAITYFDPVSSPTIVPRARYLQTGKPVAQRTLARIKGPTATHLASGRSLALSDDLAETGTAVVGVGPLEDLAKLKAAAAGRFSLLGNLNGIAMRAWTPAQAEAEVRQAIAKAGRGGGFLLGEGHGEVPLQVPEAVLLALGEAVERWGRYPLDWVAPEAAP